MPGRLEGPYGILMIVNSVWQHARHFICMKTLALNMYMLVDNLNSKIMIYCCC